MVNMCGNTAGFITPMLTSAMTGEDPTDVNGWRHLFWISSGLLLASLVVFTAFARFEPAKFEYEDEKDLMAEAPGVTTSPQDSPAKKLTGNDAEVA